MLAMKSKRTKKPRLFIVREPTGRRHRGEMKLEACSPGEAKRLRDAALNGMREKEWGTELGRLFLTGRVTASQFSVGGWFTELSANCRRAIDAPKDCSDRSAFVEKDGGHPPDPYSDKGLIQATKDREAVKTFMEAHAALIGAGMLAERAVRLVCEDNQMIVGHAQLLHLCTGLDWLIEYRRLTAAANNGR